MNYKNPLPSPYDYEKLGAYLHALIDAGAAHNVTEARKLARRLIPAASFHQKPPTCLLRCARMSF